MLGSVGSARFIPHGRRIAGLLLGLGWLGVLLMGCDEPGFRWVHPPSNSTQEADSAARVPRHPYDANLSRCRVVGVVDGDTIRVDCSAGPSLPSAVVRLIGVDAPEFGDAPEPHGSQATAFVRRKLLDETVWLTRDISQTDPYGRSLRYVWTRPPPAEPGLSWLRDHLFNARLLLEGYAEIMSIPPDVRYADHLRSFRNEARKQGRGLWGGKSAKSSESNRA